MLGKVPRLGRGGKAREWLGLAIVRIVMKFERRNLFSTNHNVFILKPDSLVDFYLI